MEDILQVVHMCVDVLQFLTGKPFQHHLDRRKHLQGVPECDEVPGIGRLVGDLAQQPLQIVDGVQVFPDFIPGDALAAEFLQGVQPLFHLSLVDQGLLQHAAQ